MVVSRAVRLIARILVLAVPLSLATAISITPASAAVTIGGITGNYVSSTGGGGLGDAQCVSNGVLSGIGGSTTNYETSGTYRATLTQLYGHCATINANGLTISSVANNSLGSYGGAGTALTDATCGTANGTQVIVGARLYKTSTSGFAGGVTLKCGTLPLGTSRTFGASLGATQGSYEDIECAVGSVAVGLYVYYGGILDKFGIKCAPIQNITQSITFSTINSQLLSTGTYGINANSSASLTLSYSSANNAICSVSGSTITLVSAGTCSITASQSGDTNYQAATSVTRSFAILAGAPTVTTSTSDRDAAGSGYPIATSVGWTGSVTITGTNLSSCTAIVATNNGWSGSISLTSVSNTSATFTVPTTSTFRGSANLDCGGTIYTITNFLERVDAPVQSGTSPGITGTNTYGQVLTATRGSWLYSPTSYSYQWQSAATSGGTYTNIAGATAETFTVTTSEVGLYIKVAITATNFGGSATAYSAATTQLLRAAQTISITSLGTSSKSYPYSQALSISTAQSGSGAKTYSVANGTASGCALSSTSSSTPTLTATTSGTCQISVSIAQDAAYLTASSSTTDFTFSKAGQAALSISGTSGTYGTNLLLTTSGGNGTGSNTFTTTAGTTTCTVNTDSLTASSAGNCYVTVVKAGDTNYLTETSTATLITFSRANQSLVLSSIGTTSKTYPYSQSLTMATSGMSGTGAISYAVSDGTATGCSLSDSSSSTPTISASTSGTCSVTATVAQDGNYNSATSSSINFTFSRASQSALSVTSTSGSFGTSLTLEASGGSSSGSISYTYAPGTTTCTLNNGVLTANGSGTCKVIATRAADVNYNSISSTESTITFARGNSTATITFAAGTMYYKSLKPLTATTNTAGTVTFRSNGVYIAGCRNLRANSANSYQVTCSFKPVTHGAMKISVTFDPSNPDFIGTTTVTQTYYVLRRTGQR